MKPDAWMVIDNKGLLYDYFEKELDAEKKVESLNYRTGSMWRSLQPFTVIELYRLDKTLGLKEEA